MRFSTWAACSVGACALWAGQLLAVPNINVGDFTLKADTPNQQIQIFVTGGDLVEAVNLRVQVADGGPAVTGHAGPPTGPAITGNDVLTGTIFANNNTGATDPNLGVVTTPQFSERRTLTNPATFPNDTVPAQGLLTTLTLDTTGFKTIGQQFALLLTGTLPSKDYNTDFINHSGPVVPIVTNGTITIVQAPEPSMLLGLAAMGAGAFLRRRARTPRRVPA